MSGEGEGKVAVLPGSFDPPHVGHLDLIERSRLLFDRLYVAVLDNESKQPLFPVAERIAMLEELTATWDDCVVESFSGLLVEYARSRGAIAVIRGLRSVTDFDYELPMTRMNRHLAPGVDTLYLLATADHSSLSSSLIKEVARLGGDVSGLVPPVVLARLRAALRP
ncbi:MAG TPA: pantetheine-phosphate adenylyltransferase [Thermoanaerobaculia bacterium]|nr:pantetheine-phosphate adenylyltransferase [Thermoanaerobaculia bacterium]